MKAGWYGLWAGIGWTFGSVIGQGFGCLFWIVAFVLFVTVVGSCHG